MQASAEGFTEGHTAAQFTERRCSATFLVCALRFFYGVTLGQAIVPERIAYAREPSRLPVVLSADEVVRFFWRRSRASRAAPR